MQQHNQARRELLIARLRNLYEGLGYTRFSMRRFEEYAMYLENKSFLKSDSVLTFTNPDGKLMALKPDVTLSIVKHARSQNSSIEKVYYQESVYRLASTAKEFVEIDQMGVEALGLIDAYTTGEVLRLAIETLQSVGGDYVLDISHMGFAASLMDAADITAAQKELLFGFIRQKNAHELAEAIRKAGIAPFYAQRIEQLAGLSGSFPDTLKHARQLSVSDGMEQALAELEALYAQFSTIGLADHLQLDFSMINDLDYYNGIVFQGYVQGAPRVVLSGGRYDHLMRRFEKQGDGIGFAIYLDELNRAFANADDTDVDVLVLYRSDDDVAKLNAAVFALAAQGIRVLAVTSQPRNIRAAKIMILDGESLKEVP